ncbi:DUF4328 domain-containing protein [Intrasporangium sp. YIM S08009]|uniref:DUF4328 domain-containing protein n=1 Tax=Intrasporangium zincisolvens TaxID=3080018 RepID=UPI002B05EF46|nr:DUF4328 domain-containing protein [Intrasporangium sp. YIM S08009]
MSEQTALPTVPPPPPAGLPAPESVPAGYAAPSPTAVPGRPWRVETDRWGVVAAALLLLQVPLLIAQIVTAGSLLDAWEAQDAAAIQAASEHRAGLAVVGFVALVVCAVVLVTWLHRVRTSDRCEGLGLALGPRLAVWGWFIPVVSVVLGPLAVRDVCIGVDAAAERDRGRPVQGADTMSVALTVWTLGWVGAQVADVLQRIGAPVIAVAVPDLVGIRVATWTHHLEVASTVGYVLAALALVVLIRRVGLTVRR